MDIYRVRLSGTRLTGTAWNDPKRPGRCFVVWDGDPPGKIDDRDLLEFQILDDLRERDALAVDEGMGG